MLLPVMLPGGWGDTGVAREPLLAASGHPHTEGPAPGTVPSAMANFFALQRFFKRPDKTVSCFLMCLS